MPLRSPPFKVPLALASSTSACRRGSIYMNGFTTIRLAQHCIYSVLYWCIGEACRHGRRKLGSNPSQRDRSMRVYVARLFYLLVFRGFKTYTPAEVNYPPILGSVTCLPHEFQLSVGTSVKRRLRRLGSTPIRRDRSLCPPKDGRVYVATLFAWKSHVLPDSMPWTYTPSGFSLFISFSPSSTLVCRLPLLRR
ncbi:hypothetical protein EV421DRAFT_796763 [Armillaria borealis]|uniref:Uncharacterized protein n=1 Tax=Armillaria borealis TaxID=47425 RepID=A0AA39JEL2_9AGAR|nr:hypothetical protein EV421DRAFT_796763 [Armillaria borealis]